MIITFGNTTHRNMLSKSLGVDEWLDQK